LDRGADETVTVYGFLYSGYKKEYWYWEILVLLRKIAVVAISVFLSAEVSSANGPTSELLPVPHNKGCWLHR
jgi:hypothetical protein